MTNTPEAEETVSSEPVETQKKSNTRLRDAGIAVGCSLCYLSIQRIVIAFGISNPFALLTLNLFALILTINVGVFLSRSLRVDKIWLVLVLISASVILPFTIIPLLPLEGDAAQAAISIWRNLRRGMMLLPGIRGVLLIILACCVGVLIAKLIKEIKLLLPVAVVLALVDLYVVFGGGLVTQAVSGNSPSAQIAMSSLSVSLTPRTERTNQGLPPLTVGFADYLFIALFFSCFARFGVAAWRTLGLLCVTLVIYLVFAVKMPLPALVPIAVVIIAMNYRQFQYTKQEKSSLMTAGILVLVILGILVLAGRQ